MKIVKLNKIGVQQAVAVLKRQGVIVYPTDTAYGLGGIYNSKKVVNKILKIKKRQDKKFTLVASSLAQVEKNFKLNLTQKKLAQKFWPGPLSIVVSKNFAVRVPSKKVTRDLAHQIGKPLIATSTNLSGGQTLYDVKKIIEQFKNKKNQPDLIIDAGKLPKKKVSTVVKVLKNKVNVIRQGAVKLF